MSQSVVLNQIKSATEFYSGQILSIYSTVNKEFAQYSYYPINAQAIDDSIQISTSQFITYYASMSNVFVLTSNSTSYVDASSVFSGLTLTV